MHLRKLLQRLRRQRKNSRIQTATGLRTTVTLFLRFYKRLTELRTIVTLFLRFSERLPEMEKLKERISVLGKTGILEQCRSSDSDLTASTMRLDGRLYMAKLEKGVLKRLYLECKGGSLVAMNTVSMLYITGFGIEESASKALRWSSFSLLEAADVSFDEALDELKADIRDSLLDNTNDDSVYPDFRKIIPRSLKKASKNTPATLDVIKEKLKGERVHLSPVFRGVKTTLIYKTNNLDCHLYECLIDDGSDLARIAIDQVVHVPIVPRFLGEIRNSRTIVDYNSRVESFAGRTFEYYAVQGFLVVPNSKKPQLKEKFPDIKSTLDLVNKFLDSAFVHRLPFIDNSVEIKNLEDLCVKIKRDARKYYDEKGVNNKKLKQQYIDARMEIRSLIGDQKLRKEQQLSSYPEYYLQFIATEIFGIDEKNRVVCVGLDPKVQPVHLTSLGFRAINHTNVERSYLSDNLDSKMLSEYTAWINKMYGNEFNVSGVVVRPYHLKTKGGRFIYRP